MKTQLDDLRKELHTAEIQLYHSQVTNAPEWVSKEIQEKIHNIKSTIINIQ
tara:strand:- start:971 stop:1123 length:153 start_codon:yes stop_codon:yes gene_type:complete